MQRACGVQRVASVQRPCMMLVQQVPGVCLRIRASGIPPISYAGVDVFARARCRSSAREDQAVSDDGLQEVVQGQASPSADAGMGAQRMAGGGRMAGGALHPGDVLQGKYTVVDVLGSGSSATAYRATTTDGRDVAIKALSLSGMRDWKQLEMFQREAKVLASLSHPAIPNYIDYFEADSDDDRSFYIVQEAVVGKTLASMVQSGMRATDDEAGRIAEELLGVLDYLAVLRPPCVHRDIKPENIMVEGGEWGGRVYLVDFGGVQAVAGDAMSLGSTVIGTYGYMAPEQFQGNAQVASDVYALGGTLLFLLTGRAPNEFPQERMRIQLGDAVQFPGGRPWASVLSGMMDPVAEDRLSAQQAKAVLRGEAVAPVTRPGAGRVPPSALSPPRNAVEALVRMSGVSVAKPANTRVQLSRTPTRLDIVIPPKGLDINTGFTGAFAIAWNAFVAVWTVGALASGGILFALFSLPFWFAGVQIGRQAVVGALMRERFAFGTKRFRLAQELAMLSGDGADVRFDGGSGGEDVQEGQTADLLGARVVTTIVVNGEPQTAIEVLEGVRKWRFGEGLELVEQQWLVCNINEQLEEMRGSPVDYAAFPAEDMPESYRDDTTRSDLP